MRASLTRRVVFASAHRYGRPEWSEAENGRVFGSSAMPNFHGHNYSCEVTVVGDIDQQTGFVVNLGELDEVLRSEIMNRFDHRNINLEVAEFADGKLVPTTENLARFIFERVQSRLSGPTKVARVVLSEDEHLKATYPDD